MADTDYSGRLVVGHVFWVRDANNQWHPIATLRGVEGAKGETGSVICPKIDAQGNLSWYVSDEARMPSTVNIRGPQGVQGETGPQGPRGVQGPQGEKGDAGDDPYEVAKSGGYTGTPAEFYEALAKTVQTAELAEEAHDLAMQNNHAHVFQTKEEYDAWMGDPQMRQLLNVGDFIIVKETNTRTYWDGNAEQPLDYSGTITAEQVTVGTWETNEVRANGEDNYNPVYGFGMNLETLSPDSVPDGNVARVRSIAMRTSMNAETFGEAKTVYLVLTGTDGRVWTSDEPQVFEKANTVLTFTFSLGADLPGGVAEARFVGAYTQAVTGVPLRVTRTGTQPEGNYIVIDKNGGKRTNNGPALIPVVFSSVGTVAGELDKLEEQISAMATAYHYKGTVVTVEDLPTEGNAEGDVWNVESDGMNYAWTGEAWDALGPTIDLSAYYTKTEADGRYLKLTGGTVTGDTIIMGTSFKNRGWLFANNIAEGGVWIVSKYAAKTHTHAMGDVSGLADALAAKQDKLVAGDGITIAADGKTISATGGGDVPSETALLSVSSLYDDTYIWFERKDGAAAPVIGFGFGDYSDMDVLRVASSISGGQPSVTNVPTVYGLETALATKQDALTAGSGISISGNVISATGGGTVSFESATGESGVICRDSDTQCTLKVSRLTAEDYISISASWGTSGGGVDVPTKSYVDGLVGDISAALAAI